MMRHFKVIGLPVLITLVGVGFYALWPREPKVDGRAFHEWVVDLESSKPDARAKARAAIQHMGRKAVPYVIALLRPPQPTWREKLAGLLKRPSGQATFSTRLRMIIARSQMLEERARGLAACDALGPMAIDAAPYLQTMFHQERNFDAAYALYRLGPKAVLFPAGLQADYYVRITALYFMDVGGLPGEGLPEKVGAGASFRERARAHHDQMLAVWWPKHNAPNPSPGSLAK
jgi:hypothetical protein